MTTGHLSPYTLRYPFRSDFRRFTNYYTTNVADDLILVQLGTKNPGQTEDERKKWTEGLKEVVKVLRQRGVNDPELVAKEIANYRRQFLGDETRVLNL